jgi:endo-1,4-beta-xylanase
VAIVKMLQQAGARIDGVGIQEHVSLVWPQAQELDASIRAFGEVGVKVAITELDVTVLPDPDMGNADVGRRFIQNTPALDPYVAGLPAATQTKLAERYAELFGVYLANKDVVERVTLWAFRIARAGSTIFPCSAGPITRYSSTVT